MHRSLSLLGAVLLMLLIAAGCDSSESTTTEESTTATASVEETPTVTFDGTTCVYDGPTTLPAGTHVFVLTNESDNEQATLRMATLLEGHTYQDVTDLQAAAGGAPNCFARTDWFINESMVVAASPDLTLADNQDPYAFKLDAGSDALFVGAAPDACMREPCHSTCWRVLCAPIEVTG